MSTNTFQDQWCVISSAGRTLFHSSVDGVDNSIVVSSKFKCVHGLSFSSCAGRGEAKVSLTLEKFSRTTVASPFGPCTGWISRGRQETWQLTQLSSSLTRSLGCVPSGLNPIGKCGFSWSLFSLQTDREVVNILSLWRHKRWVFRLGQIRLEQCREKQLGLDVCIDARNRKKR